MPNEFMNPTVENPGIISMFTLLLLEESNWYKFDENAAMPYSWGKGDGCAHFNSSPCPLGEEYCSSNNVGQKYCSNDYMSPSSCGLFKTFMGSCPVHRAISDTHCVFGTIDPET